MLFSNRARISSTFHTVVLGPSFVERGYFPDLTPAHQEDLLIGISGKLPDPHFESPMIWLSRKYPVFGSSLLMTHASFLFIGSGGIMSNELGYTDTPQAFHSAVT